MQILAMWKDCDYFGRQPVTAYWIGVENGELEEVLSHSSEPDRLLREIERFRPQPGTLFYLLVSKDLEYIVALFREYPFSSMWNAYNPFVAIGPVEIESLQEVANIDEDLLQPIYLTDLPHFFGRDWQSK